MFLFVKFCTQQQKLVDVLTNIPKTVFLAFTILPLLLRRNGFLATHFKAITMSGL